MPQLNNVRFWRILFAHFVVLFLQYYILYFVLHSFCNYLIQKMLLDNFLSIV